MLAASREHSIYSCTASTFSREPDAEDGAHSKALGACVGCLSRTVARYPHRTLGVWGLIIIANLIFAPKFMGIVTAMLEPLPDSPSGEAKVVFEHHFPDITGKVVDTVLFTLSSGDYSDNVTRGHLDSAADTLEEVIANISVEHSGFIEGSKSWRTVDGPLENNTIAGNNFISSDGRTFLLQLIWTKDKRQKGPETKAFNYFLQSVALVNRMYSPHGIEVVATGAHALLAAATANTMEDIGVHALMFLPVALLCMWTLLAKWQYLPLSGLCIVTAVLTAFTVGYFVGCLTKVDANVPTIIAFLCIALSTDWSFFLLTRFGEECKRGLRHGDAVHATLCKTGANIMLSGVVILCSSVCMFPMPAAIASCAIGVICAVCSGLSVCLTMLPALLLSFPECFGVKSARDDQTETELSDDSPYTHRSRSGHPLPDLRDSLWYKWAAFVTRWPNNVCVILALCLVFMPTTLRLRHYRPSISDDLLVPQGVPAVIANVKLHRDFPHRKRFQSTSFLLIEANALCTSGVRSNGFFGSTCDLGHALVNMSRPHAPMAASDVFGVAFYNQPGTEDLTCIPWSTPHRWMSTMEAVFHEDQAHLLDGHMLLSGDSPFRDPRYLEFHDLYAALWEKMVSSDDQAAIIAIQFHFDIMTEQGFQWVQDLRRMFSAEAAVESRGSGLYASTTTIAPSRGAGAISTFFHRHVLNHVPRVPHFFHFHQHSQTAPGEEECNQVHMWEFSEISVWYDYVTRAMHILPISLVAACLLTLPFLIGAFGCVISPVKLVATVILPLTWVYGSAVMTYQDGLFDFLGPDTPVHSADGLHWMVPCCTIMLQLSLALDYDLFYFGRVYELRKSGVGDLESIQQGLAATGPVITCAGVIFAIEFSGLFFSKAGLNKQFGFVVVLGVILDTFVIRSTLVPAVLSIGASWNWWPAAMPDADDDTRSLGSFDLVDSDEDVFDDTNYMKSEDL